MTENRAIDGYSIILLNFIILLAFFILIVQVRIVVP